MLVLTERVFGSFPSLSSSVHILPLAVASDPRTKSTRFLPDYEKITRPSAMVWPFRVMAVFLSECLLDGFPSWYFVAVLYLPLVRLSVIFS